ncbi:MAG: hypothetical protein IJO33_04255 [Bacilli bacterium]|nr:hypothetical protein [Bacilli bacterium]
MKKMCALLLTLVMTFALCGCGEEKVKQKESVTKTCTLSEENVEEIFKLSATDGEDIDKVDLTMIFDNDMFGVDSLNVLDDTQKEQLKTNVVTTLGLDSDAYEGLTINIDIQDQMTVTINADINKADAEVLKKIGMDFTDADMSIENAVKDLTDGGATCK